MYIFLFDVPAIIDRPGVDVLGQVQTKKNYECVCPNCQRNLAASRFAPHLEKCMGMGRNSSRIASRRLVVEPRLNGEIPERGVFSSLSVFFFVHARSYSLA